jgi:hypothetical protein
MTRPQPDAFLPIVFYNVPCDDVFCGPDLRPNFAHYVKLGVVRVIAGATHCRIIVDIKRPYFRPRRAPLIEAVQ